MNFLIVDDNSLIVEDMIAELDRIDKSWQKSGATSAKEALALCKKNSFDVAYLDIEIGGDNGIELACAIKDYLPRINIIFVTGHPEYAMESYKVYASGFLVKPVDSDDIRESLEHLRNPVQRKSSKAVRVQCFGNFEVFANDKPIVFKRKKAKELLAYLVDRKGAAVTMGELEGILFEDEESSASQKNYVRVLVGEVKKALEEVKVSNMLVKGWNSVAVDTSVFDCDYYELIDGNPLAINDYFGEYMSQYSWAEMTLGRMWDE